MKTISLVLNQVSIQKFQSRNVMLRDSNAPHLFFRYSKSEKHVGSFHCRFSVNGKSTSRVIGKFPMLSVKAARTAATSKLKSYEAAKYAATKVRCFKNCGELLNWYREFRCADSNISLNTKRNIEHHIDGLLKPILGDLVPLDLSANFMSEVWLKAELTNYQISTLKSSFQC